MPAYYLLVAAVMLAAPAIQKKEKMQPGALVEKHLQYFGGGEDNPKTLQSGGAVKVQILTGGNANLDGKMRLVSSGSQMAYEANFGVTNYQREHFWTDGKTSTTAFMNNAGGRSPLSDFLYVQKAILNEGLFGGVLSAAWPLLHLEARRPRLKVKGTKKIDGVELWELEYRFRKGGGNLRVRLFFRVEDSAHVLTTYDLTQRPNQLPDEIASARQEPTRFHLEERFSDFHEQEGLMVPKKWVVQFSQSDTTNSVFWQWTMDVQATIVNANVDPAYLARPGERTTPQ